MMTFDPTISLGTILSAVTICLTIGACCLGFYAGVTRHMTKTEEQILAMLERIEQLEEGQKKHADQLGGLAKLLAATQAVLELVQRQVQAMYERSFGG